MAWAAGLMGGGGGAAGAAGAAGAGSGAGAALGAGAGAGATGLGAGASAAVPTATSGAATNGASKMLMDMALSNMNKGASPGQPSLVSGAIPAESTPGGTASPVQNTNNWMAILERLKPQAGGY